MSEPRGKGALRTLRNRFATALRLSVSLGLIALVFTQVSLREVGRAILATGYGGMFWVVIGLCGFLFLGALRVYLVARTLIPVSLAAVSAMYCRSVALGAFTPGQVGELSLAWFLGEKGASVSQGLAVSVIDRVTTLTALLLLSAAGLLLYGPLRPRAVAVTVLLAPVAFLALLLLPQVRPRIVRLAAGWVPRTVPFLEAFSQFFLSHPFVVIANLGLGLARWAVAAMMLLVVIEPLSVAPVDRIYVLFANAAARLLTFVPVSVNGLGVLEMGAVELFDRIGIPADLTLAAFFVNRAVYYVFAATLALEIIWRRSSSDRRQSQPARSGGRTRVQRTSSSTR